MTSAVRSYIIIVPILTDDPRRESLGIISLYHYHIVTRTFSLSLYIYIYISLHYPYIILILSLYNPYIIIISIIIISIIITHSCMALPSAQYRSEDGNESVSLEGSETHSSDKLVLYYCYYYYKWPSPSR